MSAASPLFPITTSPSSDPPSASTHIHTHAHPTTTTHPFFPSRSQVLGAGQQLPGEFAAYYIDQLTSTVRDEIASCSERAYVSLTLGDAQKLMMFKSAKEAAAYAQQVRAWACGV